MAKKLLNNPVILLFGLPRSGTTWVGKIFDSNKHTLYMHEPDTWHRLRKMKILATKDDEFGDHYSEMVSNMLVDVLESAPDRVFGKTPVFQKQFLNPLQFYCFTVSIYLNKIFQRLSLNWPIYNISQTVKDGNSLVWKSIESVGRLGIIHESIKDCRSVLILRHPAGYIASVLRGESKEQFTDKKPSADDINFLQLLLDSQSSKKFNLKIQDFEAMTDVERLAWRWVILYEHALDNFSPENNSYILKYEALCEHPAETTEDMFQQVGLEMGTQTHDFLQQSTEGNSDSSYYSVKKDPLMSAYNWKRQLTETQQQQILDVLKRSERLSKYYTE
jgi:hypothetical protein